jgi:hypothetical protein
LFELRQLARNGLLPRTVFVVDDTTDVPLLESVLAGQAREAGGQAGPPPLNIERIRPRSGADLDRVYGTLAALASPA